MNDEQNTREALLRLIDKVHRQYETWYAKVSRSNFIASFPTKKT